ncbi:MAG: sulfotransferase [Actinomycetota bacterium]|nr:sulfotransferase [Actinomycetota bacterium]
MAGPNFLVVGAAKAGTTALYDYLRQHPDVYMSALKETNYLALQGQRVAFTGPGDDATINRLSVTTASGYAAQFAGVTTETAVGEASPLYLYDPAVPQRVATQLPDAKVLAVLRHPAERAYSAFLHATRDGREPLGDFAAALADEPARVRAGWEHLWHYAGMGFYGAQLERWCAALGRNRVHAFLYDDLVADPAGALRSCFAFLGVDGAFVPDMRVHPNASRGRDGCPPLDAGVRAALVDVYRDDVARLQRLLGRDLSTWLR